MRRVGELWRTAQITVDAEHYCTSVTQMAITQMYPLLFSSERRNRTLLCACPGTELHEMGARMVADIFENDGWDSIYLGAAVPEDAMLEAIRREFPESRIAVGGKAFQSTHQIWKQWPIDFYVEDARELLQNVNTEMRSSTVLLRFQFRRVPV